MYSIGGRIATVNMVKGRRVYGEELVGGNGIEYRLWNPYRSKLAAALLNRMGHMEIKGGSRVLYLGAATGTTASHVSDIIGPRGRLFGVEISERNMREFLGLCDLRANMLPILADASHPDAYLGEIGECDIIYQDISSRNQAEILLANSVALKKGGYAYFIIKSQSIDIARRPEDTYRDELAKLRGAFAVDERIDLEPYDSMHLFAVLKKI